MTHHTPGPWSYGTRGADFETAEICTVFNIPTLPTEDGKGQAWAYISAGRPCFEVKEEEREANARLIAAAPDLLGALRFILAFYEPGQRHLDTEAWKVAEASARAAVAKAEGK